jgi:hypothetical protein
VQNTAVRGNTYRSLFLNVRGIISKIDYGLLQDLVNEYDFVGMAETRSNMFDTSAFPRHDVFTGKDGNTLKGFYGLALLIINKI